MTTTADDLVRREVYHCVSALVSTLASGYGAAIEHVDSYGRRSTNGSDLANLTEQAFELSCPLPDWEEAALDAGCHVDARTRLIVSPEGVHDFPAYGPISADLPDSWRTICDDNDIEPYDREVYEHWVISDWLADKLEAYGEKVGRDFAGLTVWARTTTGQAIAQDYVIERITADLNRAD